MKETRKARAPDLRGQYEITVGIHEADGRNMRDDATFAADGALEPGQALTVAEVATFHEFGLGVPQRSFIRGWFDENQGEIAKLLQSQLALAVAGKITVDQALERVALKAEASVKLRIRNRGNGAYPALAASTIKRKGSSVPLIDTGQQRAAIRGKVTKK